MFMGIDLSGVLECMNSIGVDLTFEKFYTGACKVYQWYLEHEIVRDPLMSKCVRDEHRAYDDVKRVWFDDACANAAISVDVYHSLFKYHGFRGTDGKEWAQQRMRIRVGLLGLYLLNAAEGWHKYVCTSTAGALLGQSLFGDLAKFPTTSPPKVCDVSMRPIGLGTVPYVWGTHRSNGVRLSTPLTSWLSGIIGIWHWCTDGVVDTPVMLEKQSLARSLGQSFTQAKGGFPLKSPLSHEEDTYVKHPKDLGTKPGPEHPVMKLIFERVPGYLKDIVNLARHRTDRTVGDSIYSVYGLNEVQVPLPSTSAHFSSGVAVGGARGALSVPSWDMMVQYRLFDTEFNSRYDDVEEYWIGGDLNNAIPVRDMFREKKLASSETVSYLHSILNVCGRGGALVQGAEVSLCVLDSLEGSQILWQPFRPLDCGIVGITEPLKTRTITTGEAVAYYLGKPVQQMWVQMLKPFDFVLPNGTHGRFDMFAASQGPVTAEILKNTVYNPRAPLLEDNLILSADYTGATNNLYWKLSYKITRALCELWGFSPTVTLECIRMLIGHQIHYHRNVIKKVFDKNLNEMIYKAVSDDFVVRQENGQLMGSILSFIVLCLANYVLVRYAYELDQLDQPDLTRKPPKVPLHSLPFTINGDDMAIRCRQRFLALWEEISGYGGMCASPGKTLAMYRCLTLNSIMFEWKGGQFVRVPFLDCKSARTFKIPTNIAHTKMHDVDFDTLEEMAIKFYEAAGCRKLQYAPYFLHQIQSWIRCAPHGFQLHAPSALGGAFVFPEGPSPDDSVILGGMLVGLCLGLFPKLRPPSSAVANDIANLVEKGFEQRAFQAWSDPDALMNPAMAGTKVAIEGYERLIDPAGKGQLRLTWKVGHGPSGREADILSAGIPFLGGLRADRLKVFDGNQEWTPDVDPTGLVPQPVEPRSMHPCDCFTSCTWEWVFGNPQIPWPGNGHEEYKVEEFERGFAAPLPLPDDQEESYLSGGEYHCPCMDVGVSCRQSDAVDSLQSRLLGLCQRRSYALGLSSVGGVPPNPVYHYPRCEYIRAGIGADLSYDTRSMVKSLHLNRLAGWKCLERPNAVYTRIPEWPYIVEEPQKLVLKSTYSALVNDYITPVDQGKPTFVKPRARGASAKLHSDLVETDWFDALSRRVRPLAWLSKVSKARRQLQKFLIEKEMSNAERESLGLYCTTIWDAYIAGRLELRYCWTGEQLSLFRYLVANLHDDLGHFRPEEYFCNGPVTEQRDLDVTGLFTEKQRAGMDANPAYSLPEVFTEDFLKDMVNSYAARAGPDVMQQISEKLKRTATHDDLLQHVRDDLASVKFPEHFERYEGSIRILRGTKLALQHTSKMEVVPVPIGVEAWKNTSWSFSSLVEESGRTKGHYLNSLLIRDADDTWMRILNDSPPRIAPSFDLDGGWTLVARTRPVARRRDLSAS